MSLGFRIIFLGSAKIIGAMFMHGSCKSVSDGERYVIIVLVDLLVLRGEAVVRVRVLDVVAATTHTNLHSSSVT